MKVVKLDDQGYHGALLVVRGKDVYVSYGDKIYKPIYTDDPAQIDMKKTLTQNRTVGSVEPRKISWK